MAPARAADLVLSGAWIRWLPAGVPAGGYFTLLNQGKRPVTLVEASSPAFGMVMMHKSEEKGGVSKMLPVERVTVPPNGKLVFAPGGYHLMLMDPGKGVAPGKKIAVTLSFSDGQKVTGDFAVRGPASP